MLALIYTYYNRSKELPWLKTRAVFMAIDVLDRYLFDLYNEGSAKAASGSDDLHNSGDAYEPFYSDEGEDDVLVLEDAAFYQRPLCSEYEEEEEEEEYEDEEEDECMSGLLSWPSPRPSHSLSLVPLHAASSSELSSSIVYMLESPLSLPTFDDRVLPGLSVLFPFLTT